MFVYVAPEFEGSGIASGLIEMVKAAVAPGVPVILQCEGTARKRFFERRGFVVTEWSQEIDTYYMRWEPTVSAQ
jgi:GNAT superfamily N-acetyltransferase